MALIAGPTASGKSDIALQLAERLAQRGKRGVIVNADSAQIYADLPILSAAPGALDMARAEHRLYGAWDGAQGCSAADWAARAKAEIADIHAAGAVPILVGGTGLYIRTLLDGIAPVPEIAPDIRAQTRALPVAEAHAALTLADPEAAARLHPADTTRIARALEVIRATGKPLSYWQAHMAGGIGAEVALAPLILLPPRDWLYERCDRRFAAMISAGAEAEVAALLARGLDGDLPVMRAIGVAEIAAHLAGHASLEAAIAAGTQATRRYAKRQYTWFRHQAHADWARLERAPHVEDVDIDGIFVSLFH